MDLHVSSSFARRWKFHARTKDECTILDKSSLQKPRFIRPKFFSSLPFLLSWRCLHANVPSSNEAKNLGEIYLRYKYRWLIVTTNTFARISSGTQPSDLSRQSWKKRKGSWIMGAQSTWPAPETFHRNPRIRFANTRWNLVCGICGMKYLFSSTRGGGKMYFLAENYNIPIIQLCNFSNS